MAGINEAKKQLDTNNAYCSNTDKHSLFATQKSSLNMSLGNMPNTTLLHGLSVVVEDDEDKGRPNKDAQTRLTQVKDVLKNSKTLKEQLKGVCVCYDTFTQVQTLKEDQKSLSLMKNFFLQIVNKS